MSNYKHVPFVELKSAEEKIAFLRGIPMSRWDYYVAEILKLSYLIIDELHEDKKDD